MSDFLNFDDTYTKTTLIVGIHANKFMTQDGKQFDASKIHLYSDLSGDMAVGGTVTQLGWGTSDNWVSENDLKHSYPAICELKIRKAAKNMGKEVEEVVSLRYVEKAVVVPASQFEAMRKELEQLKKAKAA